jgi:PAS domain S-box-containing protein
MQRPHEGDAHEGFSSPLAVAGVALVILGVALAFLAPVLVPLVVLAGIASVLLDRGRRSGMGLQIHQMDQLREAELALAIAGSTEAAARQLAHHAMTLLDAPSATVIIEGIGDTVRVSAGATTGSVFGAGSRMRLLQDDGVPCGSIAVSARADGRGYTAQQEHMLDALAERVSSTLHRLSLFTEVQTERRTLSDVVGSSSDGIFSVGVDHAVRSWNPAMARITGVSARDAIGRPVGSVFRPVGEDGRPRRVDGDEHEVALVRLPAPDGRTAAEERWLTCSWSPLEEGGYVVVARDDTERKQLQDDKDGWIAQVSHELRTPLTPIKGFLHTLQRRDGHLTAADRRHIYDVMLREEQRLENLVNALLQATTMDAGSVALDPEPVDWRCLVDDQVDLYQRNDVERRISVLIDPAIDQVVVDPTLASGVLANLLSNAIKYSPAGSPIDVHALLDGDNVVTVVSDRGPGVADGDRERIFDKFTRLGDHLTRPQQGIGLGLYIARGSMEQLGGSIWCEERPGGGTSFAFQLPVGTPRPATPTKPAARAPRSRKKVLSPR